MNSQAPAVWIVDDDPDDQLLFGLTWQKVAPQVQLTVLSDGEELLPALKSSTDPPNLVLLDLNMQRMNGFDTLALVRTQNDYQQLPIVVLTTSNDPIDHQQALKLGANDFVTKPATTSAITTLVNQLVSKWCYQD